jgi:hypothetical protein
VALGGREEAKKQLDEYQLYEMASDLDFNIDSAELVKQLRTSGCYPSCTSVGTIKLYSPKMSGGNFNQDDTMCALPELFMFKAKWCEILQRDISFVAIANPRKHREQELHPYTFSLQ